MTILKFHKRLYSTIKGIRYFKLLNTDITDEKWKKKFRTITKVCGIDKIKAVLYVPLDLFDRIVEVRACLESFIDLGYDLSLFQLDELEIMTQKQGYFLEVRTELVLQIYIVHKYRNRAINSRS